MSASGPRPPSLPVKATPWLDRRLAWRIALAVALAVGVVLYTIGMLGRPRRVTVGTGGRGIRDQSLARFMAREHERDTECQWLKARALHKGEPETSAKEQADRTRAAAYEADSVCIPGHGR